MNDNEFSYVKENIIHMKNIKLEEKVEEGNHIHAYKCLMNYSYSLQDVVVVRPFGGTASSTTGSRSRWNTSLLCCFLYIIMVF